MGKIICPVCGGQTENKNARVCYSCDTAVCSRCAAKKQNFCDRCFAYMGYVN